MAKSSRLKIYQSSAHLAAAFLLLIIPFVFFYGFAVFAGLNPARFFSDIGVSSWRILLAYLISVVLAWVLAVAFYQTNKTNLALPLMDVLQSFPTFAALPLAVHFWGPTNFTVIFFLVVTIIWPIFFSTVSALKLVRRDWEEVVHIFHLSGFSYLKKFLLPVSLSGLITGSIVGLGEGWEALIATEMIVAIKNGLGPFFYTYSRNPLVTGFGILGFLLFIFSLNKLVWLSLLDWSHRRMED